MTYTILFDNPQSMLGRGLQQGGNENLEQGQQRHLVLRVGPKYHYASMGIWRIRLDISEVHIQGDEHATVRTYVPRQESVCGTGKILVGNSVGFESCVLKNYRKLRRQIFVDLKFQALVSRGNRTLPSRVNSAA